MVGIFLALELPLGLIAYKSSSRWRSFLVPGLLLLLAAITPEPNWGGTFLIVSLFWSFAVTIGVRARRTIADERRQLLTQGPSPWLGQSRRSSLTLVGLGLALMISGTVLDASGHVRIASLIMFGAGSIVLGIGLLRRHTVLVHYFGAGRARWLEFVQFGTGFAAYALVAAGELSNRPDTRLEFRLLSLLPFAFHFLVVWVPLGKVQERSLMAEIPYV